MTSSVASSFLLIIPLVLRILFFIFIVEKKKNSDELPLAGYRNEIRSQRRKKGIAVRTNQTH
jgi:hypothetical protein